VVGEPLDGLPGVDGLGGIDANEPDLDLGRLAVQLHDDGVAIDDALDQGDGSRGRRRSPRQNAQGSGQEWVKGFRARHASIMPGRRAEGKPDALPRESSPSTAP
jgi:hypothetical protein